jgi:hypothetical protein
MTSAAIAKPSRQAKLLLRPRARADFASWRMRRRGLAIVMQNLSIFGEVRVSAFAHRQELI